MPILRHVYDSATGTHHDVEVTQEVYDFYRRNAWAIRNNNARFYVHEIQFSNLRSWPDDDFEKIDEFHSTDHDPQCIFYREADARRVLEAFQRLSPDDQHILTSLWWKAAAKDGMGR